MGDKRKDTVWYGDVALAAFQIVTVMLEVLAKVLSGSE